MLESWHVVLRCCKRLLLAGGAVIYSTCAPALGLGDITLHSALNQPLRADIALVDAAGLEEGDLSVTLATADEFSRAGVERVFFLNDLTFTPILRGSRSLIRVSSSKPVNEPFLNFVVQLNQPNGRVLREYTALIDLPGSPGIIPVVDEPPASRPNAAFPMVKPATAPPASTKTPAPKADQPAAAPVVDPAAEQLAASVLQNEQLQATIDELNKKLLIQNEQIALQHKQVTDLQAQLAQITAAPPIEPVAPVAELPASEPVVGEVSSTTDWPLILAVLGLVALVVLAVFVRRRRQRVEAPLETLPITPPVISAAEAALDQPMAPHVAPSLSAVQAADHDDAPAGDVLEGVGIYLAYGRFSEAAGLLRDALDKEPQRTDLAVQLLEVLGRQGDVPAYEIHEQSLRDAGFDSQLLNEIRARHPKLNNAAPLAAAAVVPAMLPVVAPVAPVASESATDDGFQLNLDDLSMDSSWDLISPFDNTPPEQRPGSGVSSASDDLTFASNLQLLPDVLDAPDDSAAHELEMQWSPEPDAQSLDDDFLAEFTDPDPSPALESLHLPEDIEASEFDIGNARKLEQAQTCIDDGDLDSATELLNELLQDGDERLRQTARSLLAGIR